MSRVLNEVFGTRAKNFLEGCQKFNRRREEQIKGKITAKIIFGFSVASSFTLGQKFSSKYASLQKTLENPSSKEKSFAILISLGFWAKSFFFLNLAKKSAKTFKILAFWRKILSGVAKKALQLCRSILSEKDVKCNFDFLCFFGTLSDFSNDFEKKLAGVSKQ